MESNASSHSKRSHSHSKELVTLWGSGPLSRHSELDPSHPTLHTATADSFAHSLPAHSTAATCSSLSLLLSIAVPSCPCSLLLPSLLLSYPPPTPIMTGQTDASKTVYVISGTSSGLGLAVTEKLATRTDAIVYAGVRDPSKADKLQQLAGQHSNVHIVQLRADSEADHKAVAAQVEAEAGRADVVWANAGICRLAAWAPVENTSLAALREHVDVNTIHPLLMYQSFYQLLGRSSKARFFVSSSFSGSTGSLEILKQIPQLAYGLSKAAVNNLTRRIHFENEKIVAVPFHPGPSQPHTHLSYAAPT